LKRPIYRATSYHGHFGRVPGELGDNTFTWEKINKAADLKNAVGSYAMAGAR
jgi:S-adenosylmethionine synthetase